jgi:hypothetical protein
MAIFPLGEDIIQLNTVWFNSIKNFSLHIFTNNKNKTI